MIQWGLDTVRTSVVVSTDTNKRNDIIKKKKQQPQKQSYSLE